MNEAKSFSELMAVIQAEASTIKSVGQQVDNFKAVKAVSVVKNGDVKNIASLMLAKKKLVNLFLLDANKFVELVYRFLLGRAVDADGLENYSNGLLKGKIAKLDVVSDLVMSKEFSLDRAIAVDVGRFIFLAKQVKLLRKIGKVPGVGRLARLIVKRWDNKISREALFFISDILVNEKLIGKSEGRGLDNLLMEIANLSEGFHEQEENIATKLNHVDKVVSAAKHDFFYKSEQLRVALSGNSNSSFDDKFVAATLNEVDAFYVAFENACRGSENEIRARQEKYLPYMQKAKEATGSNLVLDIGCGRGEWMSLLKEHAYTPEGVDVNAVMSTLCREKGLSSTHADAVSYLERVSDGRYASITAFHVIEHLPFPVLFQLCKLIHQKLLSGGIVVFETPNPENVLVGSHTFYHDPTHRNPITPTLAVFMLEYFGFVNVQVERLNPYPESAKVEGFDDLTERVNGHFCGPQDYAVIGFKP